MRRLAAALLAALALAACSSGGDPVAAPTPSPTASPDEGGAAWLCRPTSGGLDDDACRTGLDAVVVAGGQQTKDPFEPAEDAPVDCFYVYPTVSRAPGLSAPLEASPEVVATVRAQAALFGEVCRVFAPLYRQVTGEALRTGRFFDPSAQALAQADVVAAWREYLEEDNDGRGVVLIGHSQGAMQLGTLLEREIAPSGRTDRVVSALLVGGGTSLAAGTDVADQAGDLPACREPGQTGCVVAYSTFAGVPAPGALFVRTGPERRPLCTDPTRLSGGDGTLHPYVPTAELGPPGGLPQELPAPDGTSAFVAYRDAATARCREEAGAAWLDVAAAPGAPDALAAESDPVWGLHGLDVTLALGDLVDVVRRQAEAWTG